MTRLTFANIRPTRVFDSSGYGLYYTAGNVGIGTNNPTATLEVSGNVIIDRNVLVVDGSNNRVGIGKTNPSVALDVSGSVSATTVSATTLTGTLSTAAQTNITSVGTLSSLTVSGNMNVDSGMLFVDSVNNRVGVNTTSPNSAYVMDVSGTLNATTITQNGSAINGSQWTTSGTNISYSGGNVGIGKSPSVALDVNGLIRYNIIRSGGSSVDYTVGGTTQYENNMVQECGSIAISGSLAQYASFTPTITFRRTYLYPPLVFVTHLASSGQSLPYKLNSVSTTNAVVRFANPVPTSESYTGSILYHVIGTPV
jgi:hypothetical protein